MHISHMPVYIHSYLYIHTRIHTYTWLHIPEYIYTCTHTPAYTHTHAHTCIYTHLYRHTPHIKLSCTQGLFCTLVPCLLIEVLVQWHHLWKLWAAFCTEKHALSSYFKKEDVSLCCCLSGAYGRMESAHLFIAYLMIAPLHVYVFQHGCGKCPLRLLRPLLRTASSWWVGCC